MTRRRLSGQALIWLTMFLPIFLSTGGLAIDGGILLMTHRHLQSVADGAARAGATRLDVDRLRVSGGADVQLNRADAAAVAQAYLDEARTGRSNQASAVTTTIDVGQRRVHVALRALMPTAFLRIAHVDAVPVTVAATADVLYGIRDGGGG